ncbi:3321_t:CDS:2, partial [Funneliformis caledonium]
ALPDKYTVKLFLNRLRKNIILSVVFTYPKNVDEAIKAAKYIESGQYYKQQSPVSTQISESNNDTKAWNKKDIICYHYQEKGHYSKECISEKPVYQRKSNKREASYVRLEVERKRQSESRKELILRSRNSIDEFMEVETPQIITPTLKKKVK